MQYKNYSNSSELFQDTVNNVVSNFDSHVARVKEDISLVHDLIEDFVDRLSDSKKINTSNNFRYYHWFAKFEQNDEVITKLAKRHVAMLIEYEVYKPIGVKAIDVFSFVVTPRVLRSAGL